MNSTLAAGDALIFSPFACFPQVPSVAAVRIALFSGNGDPDFGPGFDERDCVEFDFCEANAESFIQNAAACASKLGPVKGSQFGLTVLERSARLDGKIIETLIAMCLATANPSKRNLLEKELRAMTHWDRHKATELLAAAL